MLHTHTHTHTHTQARYTHKASSRFKYSSSPQQRISSIYRYYPGAIYKGAEGSSRLRDWAGREIALEYPWLPTSVWWQYKTWLNNHRTLRVNALKSSPNTPGGGGEGGRSRTLQWPLPPLNSPSWPSKFGMVAPSLPPPTSCPVCVLLLLSLFWCLHSNWLKWCLGLVRERRGSVWKAAGWGVPCSGGGRAGNTQDTWYGCLNIVTVVL